MIIYDIKKISSAMSIYLHLFVFEDFILYTNKNKINYNLYEINYNPSPILNPNYNL